VRKLGMVLLLSGTLFCAGTFADQVVLKNGDRLTGTIVKSDAKTLLLKTEFAGDVTVQWPAIDSITSTQPLHVGLTGGQMVVGPVTTSNGEMQVATQSAGTVTTNKDSIQVIRSDAEQKAYDAAIDRLQHPHLSDYWGGFVDSGLSTTRGNSETTNFSLGAKAIRDAPSDKITVYSNSVFAKNTTAGVTTTTAHAILGGIRADFNASPRSFAFGASDFQYDQFQMLNLRSVLSGGFGFHAIKTKTTVFDLYGGGGYDQAFYSTGVTLKNGEANGGESFSYQMSSRTSITEQLDIYPNVSTFGQFRFNFAGSAVTKVNNWLNWQVSIQNRYVSNPIADVKKDDLLLTTGIRVSFGKSGL
jgi:putative salt-induced outer membrane protein YdiY